MIVRKGDAIDSTAASFINGGLGREPFAAIAIPALGRLLLLGLAAFLLWVVLRREGDLVDDRSRVLGGIMMILVFSLVMVRFGFLAAAALSGWFEAQPFNTLDAYIPAIPFAAPALIVLLLYGRRVAVTPRSDSQRR